jgi:hypothetical protein
MGQSMFWLIIALVLIYLAATQKLARISQIILTPSR